MSEGNGHSHDAGYMRDLRDVKPCCERIANGTWCQRPAGHAADGPDGGHRSDAEPTYGPLEEPLPPRRQKGRM